MKHSGVTWTQLRYFIWKKPGCNIILIAVCLDCGILEFYPFSSILKKFCHSFRLMRDGFMTHLEPIFWENFGQGDSMNSVFLSQIQRDIGKCWVGCLHLTIHFVTSHILPVNKNFHFVGTVLRWKTCFSRRRCIESAGFSRSHSLLTSKTSRLPRLVSDLTENHPNLTKAYGLLLQSNNCDLSEHIAFLHLSIYLHDTRSTQIILILGVEHKRVGPGGHRVANLITYNHPWALNTAVIVDGCFVMCFVPPL